MASRVGVDVNVSLTGDLKGVLKGERKGFARTWEAASMRRRLAAWVDIFACDAGCAWDWDWNWGGVSAEESVLDQLVGALHCCLLLIFREDGNWDWRECRMAELRQHKHDYQRPTFGKFKGNDDVIYNRFLTLVYLHKLNYISVTYSTSHPLPKFWISRPWEKPPISSLRLLHLCLSS